MLDDVEMKECTDVPIAVNALLYSAEHEVSIDYSFEDSA